MKKTASYIAITMLVALLASNAQAQTPSSNRLVVSPYYQADKDSYTFVGVSHPSLFGSVSQIGLRVTAIGANAVGNGYAEFTISAGGTMRIFIVVTNHSILNPATLSDTTTTFITVSTGNASSGLIQALSSNLHPTTLNSVGDSNNLSQLSFWGAVVAQATNSGFAMEFVGDAHDSVAKVDPSDSTQPGAIGGIGLGRGIN